MPSRALERLSIEAADVEATNGDRRTNAAHSWRVAMYREMSIQKLRAMTATAPAFTPEIHLGVVNRPPSRGAFLRPTWGNGLSLIPNRPFDTSRDLRKVRQRPLHSWKPFITVYNVSHKKGPRMTTTQRPIIPAKFPRFMRNFGFLIGLASTLAACFPDLPPEEADAVLGADGQADVGLDTVAPDGSTSNRIPQDVVASIDGATAVTITWSSVADAVSYRVYRCDEALCGDDGPWDLVPNGETLSTSYVDLGAEGPPPPPAPSITATTNSAVSVSVSWAALSPTPARTFAYRVSANFASDDEGAPSQGVVGSRSPAPITRYEVSSNDGPWIASGAETSWQDPDAPPPTLTAGSATASQGTLAGWVALSLGGTTSTAGTTRSYRVRAVNVAGEGQPSTVATGSRAAASSWSVSWERSTGASPDDFVAITGSSGAEFQDVGAPENGATRYYRAVISAIGAESVNTEPVAGARMPPPETPGNVRASNDLPDRVEVQWSRVGSATGYKIYRDGVVAATLTGGETTSWVDEAPAMAVTGSWLAPSAVAASNDRLDGVELTWVSPTQPMGPTARYEVEAINTAGTGGKSAETVGRRAASALAEFEVEHTPMGAAVQYTTIAATTTSWLDANAPTSTILKGTTTVSQGDHRTHVRLVSEGAEVSPSKVTYRVRGVLESGDTTPWSSSTVGERGTGALTWQWQRSLSENGTYSNITGAAYTEFNDATAPANGDGYWYRLKLAAAGATELSTNSKEGWRLAFVDVRVGYEHACALTSHGLVWCWGRQNNVGRFPTMTDSPQLVGPGRVLGLENVTNVSVGTSHSCARMAGGQVYCWGGEFDKEPLGSGLNEAAPTPVRVLSLDDAAEVEVGRFHSCARTTSGSVRCWGLGRQLGNNSILASPTPVTVVTSNNTALSNVSSLSTYDRFSCATKANNGTVFCWGEDSGVVNGNPYGSIGDGGNISRLYASPLSGLTGVRKLSVSGSNAVYMACAIQGASSESLWCWGFGPIAVDNTTLRGLFSVPTKSQRFTAALREIALGYNIGCAITFANDVRCWGESNTGALGLGQTTTTIVPTSVGLTGAQRVSIGNLASCAVASYDVFCWGTNLTNSAPENFLTPTTMFPN